jgi:hypothetical protein
MTHNCSLAKKLFYVVLALFFFMSATAFTSPAKAQTTYTYTINGPFYYNGEVANSNVTIGVIWVNGSTYYTYLYGDGATNDSKTFTSTAPAYQMLWLSVPELNYTSLIDFQPSVTNYTINVYIPSPDLASYIYTFVPTDFVGITNAFLSCSLSTDGSTYNLLQQANLNFSGSPSFVLAQYGTYKLSIICDQGVYSQMFTAQNTFTDTLPILAGMFPTANVTTPTVDVTRLNDTFIGISYQDPSNSTSALSILITHPSGTSIINDYTYGPVSGSPQTILWGDADAGKYYNINVTAVIDGTSYIWVFTTSSVAPANPWLGVWDWLGKPILTMPYVSTGWPVGMTTGYIAEIIGGVVIAFFLTIGSYRSSGAVCIVAWIMSGFMIALGWWGNGVVGGVSAIPMFALSGVIAIMIQIGEGKETAREI